MKKRILSMWRNWRFSRGLRKLSDQNLDKALQIASKAADTYDQGKAISHAGGRDNLMEGIFLMSQSIQAEQRLRLEVTKGIFMGDWEFTPQSMKDFPE